MLFSKKLVKVIVGAILVVALSIGTVIYRLTHFNPPMPSDPVVSTVLVSAKNWQPLIKATGTLTAHQGIMMKSEAEGRVEHLHFQSGQDVRVGQILLELENDIQKANLAAAKVQLTLSQLKFKRIDTLFKKHIVTRADLDQAEADKQANQAAVKKTQAELAQTIIKAPFDGRLGISNVNIGEYVEKAKNIINLMNIDTLYVDFSVPEVYLNQLQKGQTVELRSTSYPDKVFYGEILVIETAIDATTRNLAVRALMLNHEHLLLPGNFVEVNVLTGKPKSVLTIPQTAIVYSTQGNYVFIVEQHHAKKALISLGEQMGQSIVITSGLKVGDEIVSAGTNKIHPGSPLKTIAEQQV